jgi:PII-like signaling protein
MAWVRGLSTRILTHERAQSGRATVIGAIIAIVRRDGLAGVAVTRADEGWSAHGGILAAR